MSSRSRQSARALGFTCRITVQSLHSLMEDSEARFRRLKALAIDQITRFSVPLYINDKDRRPLPHGTGFFVKNDTDCFLVSAAHVFDTAFERGMYYYTSQSEIRYLSGRLILSNPSPTRADDKRDVGVLKLNRGPLPPYPAVNKYHMDISYLKANYRPRDAKHYVLVGFPATKTKVTHPDKNLMVTSYAYESSSISEREYQGHGLSPKTHLIMPLDRRKGFDVAGKHLHFPKPQGMSGSPVVVLLDDNDSGSRVFPVVAVAIEYRAKSKVLVASDVSFVLEAMRHAT